MRRCMPEMDSWQGGCLLFRIGRPIMATIAAEGERA
jgi:hypothetical protein